MADVKVNHAYVSSKPSSPDSTKIDGPRWNADLVFSGGSDGEIPVRDSASATGTIWGPPFPPIPVTSNDNIPNGQARIFDGGSPRVLAIRYNDNGVFRDIASITIE